MSRRRSSKNSLRGKPSRNQKDGVMVHITHPPAIKNYSIQHNCRLRFLCLTVFNGEISFQNLLDSIFVAATAIQGNNLFTGVKIRFVEVWSNPSPVSVVPNTCSLSFNGAGTGYTGDNRLHEDISMGSQPAHIFCKPDRKSLAANFQVSSANGAFLLTCPVGSVIDVGLTFSQNLQGLAVAEQNACVGATVGAVYMRGLDGVAVAATKLIAAIPNSL